MARKVFMSVLGSTPYQECCYVDANELFKSSRTKYIQIAMLEKLKKDWNSSDIAYIFVTGGDKGSEKKNWIDDGHCKNGTNETIKSKGLNSLIEELHIELKVQPIKIKNADNESEIWDNFRIIYDCLQPDDEVYFDVTHGFRSLPMMVMVLNNYSKFLKGIKVKSISYGNYEARNELNEAPIIDLILLSNLQDWTSAANMFFQTGRTTEITQLINQEEFKALDEFVKEIAECRGVSIFSGLTAKRVMEELNSINIQDHVYKELLNKVNEKVSKFELDDLLNGFRAVEFCIQYNLIQQGITLLQEFIISFLLDKINFKDWKDELARNTVTGCLSINNIGCFKSSEKLNDDEKQKAFEIAQKIFLLQFRKKLSEKVFKKLSLGSRNDLNHAGKRRDPKPTGYFELRLAEYFELTKEILSLKL